MNAYEPIQYPQATLSNSTTQVHLFLPDSKTGYYRGARFDWSGMISRVDYAGHTFFAPWKTGPHDPENSDDVIGPAEEFGMGTHNMPPLGYADAKTGETFIKIGVGKLLRPTTNNYFFMTPYPVADPGRWDVRHGQTWIEFRQVMSDAHGWGYCYTKRVSLLTNQPGFRIEHRLENTGKKTIETDHYCHNFLSIDNQPMGPDYVLDFPFPVHAKRDIGDLLTVSGATVTFPRVMGVASQSIFTELLDFPLSKAANGVTLTHRKAGVGIRIQGSLPVMDYHFYCAPTAVCPEPFVEIHLAPGERQEWTNQYEFFLVP